MRQFCHLLDKIIQVPHPSPRDIVVVFIDHVLCRYGRDKAAWPSCDHSKPHLEELVKPSCHRKASFIILTVNYVHIVMRHQSTFFLSLRNLDTNILTILFLLLVI